MRFNKKMLFAIIAILVVLAGVTANYWDAIVSTRSWQSFEALFTASVDKWFWLLAGLVATALAGFLWKLSKKWILPRFQGRGLYVNVERCVHSPAHSRERKEPTGTRMSVTFCFENNLGKRTVLTGVKLVKPCETEKESPKSFFVLPDGRKSPYLEDLCPARYTHRFFIKDEAIVEPTFKCVFRLFYVPNAEKKISGTSVLQSR